MPKVYKSKKSSSKKSRTSKNTSQGNSNSTYIGVNLNDEAVDSKDVEAQEVPAPMSRDRAKKKGSSSGARSKTSIAGDPSLVDALLSKFTMAATPFFTQRKESSSEYLRIKERELELEEWKRQEQGELERMRIAQHRLKGIRMKYLPQTIWRKSDKERAAAMIQAIDKQLKTMRIMRSLERFVGGRLYEGDFRMLQQTI
uniref:Uncharacterized protein n=1 Tax=Tanacetum cinerariifolium TaxID=118510 RepID=A0A6L2KJ21_TANCI|nr:hypothetical protein [Tanacetum cinerariifolium]